jgi:hypothetical protein
VLRAVEQQVFVRLVADHPEIAFASHFANRLEMLTRQHRARRIVRRVQVDAARVRCDRVAESRRQSRRIERTVEQLEIDRQAPITGAIRKTDQFGNRHPMRRQHECFLARTEQRLERKEERMRAAVRDDDVVRFAMELVLARELLEDRGTERRRAALVRVVRLAGAGGGGERLDDVRGRVEIRLATFEMNDSLAGQLAVARRGHHLSELGCHAQHGAIGDPSRHVGAPGCVGLRAFAI